MKKRKINIKVHVNAYNIMYKQACAYINTNMIEGTWNMLWDQLDEPVYLCIDINTEELSSKQVLQL